MLILPAPNIFHDMKNLNDKQKKYLKNFWIIFLTPIFLLILLFTFISFGWLGFMPTFEDLENPERNLASEVYSTDGKILGTYFYENRNTVEYKDLSPYIVQALIAREDHRFNKHSGIDGVGLSRVMVKTILAGNKNEGGGSTITQQLAKNLFPRDSSEHSLKIIRKAHLALVKFKEWVIAVKLERNYSKEEIITMYLNTVPFGSEAYGIKTASRTYFNKPPDSLRIEEAALMVAMLKGTTLYNPKRNPERALQRRNGVLAKMYEQKYITKAQFDSLINVPIKLKYQAQGHEAGLATYSREFIRFTMNRSKPVRSNYYSARSFKDDSIRWVEDPLYGWCNKNPKPDGSPYNLYTDGLKIYTTIDSRMQEYAEAALIQHLSKVVQPAFYKAKKGRKRAPFASDLTDSEVKDRLTSAMKHSQRYRNMKHDGFSEREIQRSFEEPVDMRVFSWKGDIDTSLTPMDSIRYYKFFLRASFMAVDPHTGFIRAYVGGPDIRNFNYDGVMIQRRQVGSTIKPFLYTLAMNEGYKPCDKVWNVPVTFKLSEDSSYTPKNAEPTPYDGQMVPLRYGLAMSVNNISAFLIKQFGAQPVVDLLRKLGVKGDIPAVPSLCLGVPEISLYELLGAYTAFPNKGVYTQPILITRIEDKNGNVLSTFAPQQVEAINEQTAYLMLQMLMAVVRNGTANALPGTYNLRNEIGGKTGTTQKQSDGWFVGVTPDLVAGAWVGGDEPTIHFDRLSEGQGSHMALPIFGLFMQKVYADKRIHLSAAPFERPTGFSADFDCSMSAVSAHPKNEYLEDDFNK